jgi:hypothetical protein
MAVCSARDAAAARVRNWLVRDANANENVAAAELQVHAGKIVESETCHTGSLGMTLAGPHGMHALGNNRYSAS